MALQEVSLDAAYVEVSPFEDPVDSLLERLTPLGPVPVVQHGDFVLTETAAILRYLYSMNVARTLVPSSS